MPFFSIILPVYNAEHFLRDCLNSIENQSFKDWELIIINDGSTDNSCSIIKSFLTLDSKIILIDQDNKGVSYSRNQGLNRVKGSYIIFVDADDILYPGALEIIYTNLINKNWDYIRYEYRTIDIQERPLYPNYEAKARKKVSNKKLDAADCITRIVRNEYFLWSGIFRKEIIDKNHLRFMEGCTYNEDTLFMLQFFMYSKTHIYLPTTLYGYRKFEGAITSEFTEKNYQDVKKVAEIACSIYTSSKDIRMQKAIKSVIEVLYLRIIKTAYTRHEADSMLQFCCQNPVHYEWKITKLLGYAIARKCIPLIQIIRKIVRKFY